MKIAVIIPSRYGASRFPGKPLVLIKGKPLVQHTIDRVRRCKKIDFVAVATDDKRVYDAVKKQNSHVFMTPKTCKSGTDRVAFIASNFLKSYKIFINVQGDEPLIDPNLIDKLALTLEEDKKLECVTAAFKIDEEATIKSPNVAKVAIGRDGYAVYFSRSVIPYNRDNVKIKYYKHIGIYGYRRKFLLEFSKKEMSLLEKAECLEQLRALENGKKIKVIVAKHDSIGVDIPSDILKVEKYL
ncbi:MAG: 3-deoxy-manno-octulosonate cytidylyltransferase [Endomicrobium sp.]|nr:3-deoxy-manno-octulosonate cytidylyltransferase [Endomicrobium sp.]